VIKISQSGEELQAAEYVGSGGQTNSKERSRKKKIFSRVAEWREKKEKPERPFEGLLFYLSSLKRGEGGDGEESHGRH